ncbi:uncharacterized protein LOC107853686 isoform X2 [Capsicum annuum]|uniref:uncharacterized protein LOC107853686 isoform X2 n=1 Tax=Capsicum annuum TaxID=4072 RepID=UPI001FB0AFAE|nr:uncharacterized protein LOC107853686 isoform X2 [Capsicum annuum]
MSVNKKRTGVGIGVALVQWLSDDRNSLSVSDVRKNLVEFNCFYCRDADDDDVTIFENSQLQRSSGNFTYVDADDDDVTIFENSQLQRSTQKFTDLHIFSYLLDADDDDVTIFENYQRQRSTRKFTYLHIFSYLL